MKIRTLALHGATCAVVVAASSTGLASATAAAPVGAEAVYAYDTVHQTVVRESPSGGAPKVLLSGVNAMDGLYVDSRHNLYVSSNARATEIPADGSKPRPFAPDLEGVVVATDGRGNVFMNTPNYSASVLTKIAANGSRTTVSGSVKADYNSSNIWGNIGQVGASDDEYAAVNYLPTRGAASIRVTDLGGSTLGMMSGAAGTLYLQRSTSAKAGYENWVRLAAGSSTPVGVGDHAANTAAGTAPDGGFYLAQSAGVCAAGASCSASTRAVHSVLYYPPFRAKPTVIPVSGLSLVGKGLQEGAIDEPNLAVNRAGDVFVGYTDTNTPQLLKYTKKGGKPQVLTAGSFTHVVVG